MHSRVAKLLSRDYETIPKALSSGSAAFCPQEKPPCDELGVKSRNTAYLRFCSCFLYWLIAFALDASRWHKPPGLDDMVPTVIYLHLILPVTAGALVGWWRSLARGRITGGMIAGANVLVIDVAAMLAVQLAPHLNEASQGGERVTELPVVLIAIGFLGSVLGLLGAAATTLLVRLLNRGHSGDEAPVDRATRIISPRMLFVAAGLVLSVAVIVSVAVIPAVRADAIPGAVQERAAMAFTVNVIFNVVIGIVLLPAGSPRGAGLGKVLVVIAGFVSLLLGATLMDAAYAFAHGEPSMRLAVAACSLSAAGDLGAAILCLVAARGRSTLCRTIPTTM